MILIVNSDYFLNSIDELIFVMGTLFLKIETEFLKHFFRSASCLRGLNSISMHLSRVRDLICVHLKNVSLSPSV
jgi:hypothetical protein